MITRQSLPASIPERSGGQFPTFDMLSIRVQAITTHDLLAIISEAVVNEAKYVVTNLNMHYLYGLHRYSEIRDHHVRADFTHVDGLPLIPLLRLFGIRLKHENRIAYVEFLPLLAAEAAKKQGWRIYYLGSEPGVVEKGAASLRERYPGLQLRTHHGYFDTQGAENEAVLADIRAYAPDVLMVGMGMPRQEIMGQRKPGPHCGTDYILLLRLHDGLHCGKNPGLSTVAGQQRFRMALSPARRAYPVVAPLPGRTLVRSRPVRKRIFQAWPDLRCFGLRSRRQE